MSPEKQRIAIAEACGWISGNSAGRYYRILGTRREVWGVNIDEDLNAMHEAEKVLTKQQRLLYYSRLYAIVEHDLMKELQNILAFGREDVRIGITCATAAQRAEAFLRTLNLWTND